MATFTYTREGRNTSTQDVAEVMMDLMMPSAGGEAEVEVLIEWEDKAGNDREVALRGAPPDIIQLLYKTSFR